MSLWSRLFGGKRAAASRPADIVPSFTQFFGPGMGFQPEHAVLLAETVGIPATATRAVAMRLSELCLEVYRERRTEDGTTEDEVIDDHPLAMLLARPHPQFSRSKLLWLTGNWLLATGEAYWQKVNNRLGVPSELHPIPPGMVEPIVQANIATGYQITDANGKRYTVPADQMIRIFRPDPQNPWRSIGTLGPSGIAADTHKFATQHLRSHYQNDASPRVVMEAGPEAEPFTDEQSKQFYTRWREFFASRGGTRSGSPAMGPSGWTFKELSMQTGADMTPLLDTLRDDLLMAFNVPQQVLGRAVAGDRSTAETMQWVFDRYAVSSLANMISEDLTLQLAPDFDASLRVRFEDFVSEDKEFELKREGQDLDKGVRSINQVLTDRRGDEVPWGELPMVDKGKVPYDPEAALERAKAVPPQPPAGPNGGGESEAASGMEEDDEQAERQAHIRVRREFRERRRKKAA